jgi:hypothetical protein
MAWCMHALHSGKYRIKFSVGPSGTYTHMTHKARGSERGTETETKMKMRIEKQRDTQENRRKLMRRNKNRHGASSSPTISRLAVSPKRTGPFRCARLPHKLMCQHLEALGRMKYFPFHSITLATASQTMNFSAPACSSPTHLAQLLSSSPRLFGT